MNGLFLVELFLVKLFLVELFLVELFIVQLFLVELFLGQTVRSTSPLSTFCACKPAKIQKIFINIMIDVEVSLLI